jgi:glucose/arabinose dehydrogenase
MQRRTTPAWPLIKAFSLALLTTCLAAPRVVAQDPTLVDEELAVRTVVSGLEGPISMAFIGDDDFLVLEKGTGQVKWFSGDVLQGVVLDLAVNSDSERGLLGIALHPDFPINNGVYLFFTCRSSIE